MKIITLLFLCSILCKVFIVDAKTAVSTSHVNISLLESITKAIDPYQKKFYAFVCWDDSGMIKIN